MDTAYVTRYLTYCTSQKRLDPKTAKAYRIDLGQLCQKLPDKSPEGITATDLEAIFASWHESLKPKTVKRKIASARAFFAYLEEQGVIQDTPFRKVHASFREPKALPRTIPEHAVEDFLRAVYASYGDAKTGHARRAAIRDIAAMELLFATGIRVSELCAIQMGDIDIGKGELLIHGKGKKERLLQIPDPDVLDILGRYTAIRKRRDTGTGAFFLNGRGNPISDQSVRNIINKHAEKAGIGKHLTPHMFRHTFATSLLESDVNLRCIQELLGHSSIRTTEIYTHVSAAKQREVLANHHPRKHMDLHL